jgi:nitrite reductase (NADH) large subunit
MKYVILGLGVAGVTAAKTIRQLDKEGEIELFTDEMVYYYARPKLFDIIHKRLSYREIYFYGPDWYIKNNLKLHFGVKAEKIDAKQHTVTFNDGITTKYDKLLIANGAHAFVPPIKGVEKQGVFTLRTLKDAFDIRDYSMYIGNGSFVTVIGGGVLGLEAAHSFKLNKLNPTVIEFAPHLLPRQLDKEGADILKGIFENAGIKIKTSSKTEAFDGKNAVEKVILGNGEILPSRMVLLSTGVRSNIDILKNSDLPFNRGALVDDYLRLQDAEDIYAAGDIAEYKGRVYGIIPPALEQATVAGKNMVEEGSAEYHGSIMSNTLKVAGVDLTSVGTIDPEDKEQYEEIRASAPLEGKYRKIVLKDGKAVGGISLGMKGESIPLTKLVKLGKDLSSYKTKLADINFSLKEIK